MSEFDLKRALRSISSRVTDEDRAAQEKLNQEGRNLLMNDYAQRNRLAYARGCETVILENIANLQALPQSELKDQWLSASLDRLSEIYGELGKYREAIKITPNKQRREFLQKIKKAMDGKPGKKCDCPDETVIDRKNTRTIRVPAMQHIGDFYNAEKDRFIPVRVCRTCGFGNTE